MNQLNTTLKKLVRSLILVLSALQMQAQEIDSLEKLITGKAGIAKAVPLIELGFEYLRIDTIKAAKCGMEAYNIGILSKDSLIIVDGGRLWAHALRIQGKIDSSMVLYSRTLTIAKKKRYIHQILKISNGYAVAHINKANYDKALELYFEYLNMPEAKDDSYTLASVYNNMGLVYFKLKDYRKALVFYERSLELKKGLGDQFDLDQLYINIGLGHAYLGDTLEARMYIRKCLAVCKQYCSDLIATQADYAYGLIEFNLNNLETAERFFIKAYRTAKRTREIRYQLDNIDYLSQIYMKNGMNEQALKYLKEAETLIHTGLPYRLELINIYMRFSEVFTRIKNFKLTAYYQQRYIQLKDSTYNEELTTNLMRIEADYLERENQAKIVSQNQVILLNEEAIKRQNFLNISISGIAIVLVVLAIVLFKNNKQKRMINELLELRVRERTRELEVNRNELIRACSERDLLIDKTAQSIQSSLASIKGICQVGLKDISEPGARLYIQKVEETSDSLSNSLNALLHIQRRAISDTI
jgi:tetratricopeptide (TPR) repeat protein